MHTRQQMKLLGRAIPWKDCKACGAKESVITHTKTKDKWCMKCQAFSSGDK